jgi:outer membrane protein assembly factor BamB
VKWRAAIPAAARAAPTVLGGRVFITTLDNRLLALSAANGKILWEYQGLSEMTGLVGAANAAANADIVLPAFSSGEITALRVENGSVAWTDNLAGVRGQGGMSSLSDIRALPVMEDGRVLAISFGGRMVALEDRTGGRIWQRDLGGTNTPWLAGNTIFLVTADQNLMALNVTDGRTYWSASLPRYENQDSQGDALRWYGPVLAGGRLLLTGSNGQVLEVNPAAGDILRSWQVADGFSFPPVVSGEQIYFYDNSAVLHAYRGSE